MKTHDSGEERNDIEWDSAPPALGVEERSDDAPSAGGGTRALPPNPEVVAKPTRRQFIAAYRLRILEEADRCSEPGEVGRHSPLRCRLRRC